MAEQRLYVLPFRAAVIASLGVFLLGAAGGALGSWLTMRRLLRVVQSAGSGVVERVERTSTVAEDALVSAVASTASATYAVTDDGGRVVQQAVALTEDGVLVSAGPLPRGILRVQRLPGQFLPASVIRSYPEAGVWFLKATGSFSVAAMERERLPAAGMRLAAVAASSDVQGVRVRQGIVEVIRVAGSRTHQNYPVLDRLPSLVETLPPSFQGSPLVGADGTVYGLAVLESDRTTLLPGAVIDTLLADTLQHPAGTEVKALEGARGRWVLSRDGERETLTFRLTAVRPGSGLAAAHFRVGDEVSALRGKPLTGAAQLLRELLAAGRAGERLPATFQRGDTTEETELHPVIP